MFALSVHRVRFGLYKLLRTIVVIWFITTWVSCIYFRIDYNYYLERGYYFETGQLWLTNSNAVDNINLIECFPYWYVWYEYAVYWSFQTSATIGYGNMTPRNPHEVLFCNFIILINTIFFVFYINTIWEIIGEIQAPYSFYTESWLKLTTYLREKDRAIPKQLLTKIGSILQDIWINDNTNNVHDSAEEDLIAMLSLELSLDVITYMRAKIFSHLPLFDSLSSWDAQVWQ